MGFGVCFYQVYIFNNMTTLHNYVFQHQCLHHMLVLKCDNELISLL